MSSEEVFGKEKTVQFKTVAKKKYSWRGVLKELKLSSVELQHNIKQVF